MSSFTKTLRLATTIFAIALLPLTAAAQTQILANPGFEGAYTNVTVRPNTSGTNATIDGEVANGWEENSSWAGVTAVYSREGAGARNGATAQKVELKSVTSGQLQLLQQFKGNAGTRLTASVWVKGTAGARAVLTLRKGGPTYAGLADAFVNLSDQWQELKLSTFVTETDDYVFQVSLPKPATLWIDDASLTSAPGVPLAALPQTPIEKKQFGMHFNYLADTALNNPGFEGPYGTVTVSRPTITGKTAVWWQDNSDWADVTINYSEDTANARSGSSAQRIEVKEVRSGAMQLVRDLRVPKNRTYTASVWLRGTPGAEAQLALTQGGPPYETYGLKRVALTDTWQQVTVQGRVTQDDPLVMMVRAEKPLTLLVDDASITDESGNPPSGRFPDVSFGMLRLWDAGVTWAKLEPEKGRFDFSVLDRYVSEAQARGQEVILTLGQSPTWASARPAELTYLGLGASAEPANLSDWRDYITAVASRYKGRIQYYEVWNEPNDSTFFSGTVGAAITLTREAKATLNAVDPQAKLISPPAYVAGWMDQFFAGGGADHADIIGYHVYATPPEEMARGLADVRLVMEQRGVLGKKPLWNTEGAAGNASTSEDTGVGYIARAYLINFMYGAERYAWYQWGRGRQCDVFCTPTSTDDLAVANRVGRAAGVIQEWLVGATMKNFVIDAAGVYQLELLRADGKRAWVLWQPSASTTFSLPVAWNAESKRELEGGTSPLNGATSVQVGATPIMIEGVAANTGDGLTGSYFNSVDLTTPAFTRVDAKIDFDWTDKSPDAAIESDTFSVRWTGAIVPRHSEEYTFTTLSDDGVRLWVNDQLVIDQWNDHPATEHQGRITLEAGKRYAIRLEYYENYGSAQLQLRWQSPSQPAEVVPQSQLFSTGGGSVTIGACRVG